MEDVGFQQAVHTVNKQIREYRNEGRNVILVGLSVAATFACLCGQEENIVGIVGYYGSRICGANSESSMHVVLSTC